jgi:glutamyl/glutaminyl-tRNA synthetase
MYDKKYSTEWYLANKEKCIATTKAYMQAHPKEHAQAVKKHRKNHSEEYKEYQRKYREANREKLIAYRKEYNARHKVPKHTTPLQDPVPN